VVEIPDFLSKNSKESNRGTGGEAGKTTRSRKQQEKKRSWVGGKNNTLPRVGATM